MMPTRTRLIRGLVSGLLHEALVVAFSFAAMLILVRLLTPVDYGRAAAVVGVLALVRAFSGALFVEHALQHAKDAEPHWDTYFALSGIVQLGLFATTNVIAIGCRLSASLTPVAPLLHIASLGLLLDWPAQVATVKLRRELRFERLKLLSGVAVLTHLSSAIVLAWVGLGATALVVSANVLPAVPFAFTFLFVEQWRPSGGRWLFLPSAADRAPIIGFGRQQMASGIVQAVRAAAETFLLTKLFGVATFGLLNRASALYQSTVGRISLLFLETAYPLLPMERDDRQRYARRASRFIEAMLILSVPGAGFLVIEGEAVSRLLYGGTWADADPYLAPAAIALAAATLTSAASYVLLGFGLVRKAVLTETSVACGGLLALTATLFSDVPLHYMWTLAVTQVVVAIGGFAVAAPFIDREWRRRGLWPAIASTTFAVSGVITVRTYAAVDEAFGVIFHAATYATVAAAVLSVTARPVVAEVMRTQRVFKWKTPLVAESA